MSVPRPVLDESVRAEFDAIDHPVSIGTSLRDRSGEILDFRLDFVNTAAAAWMGQPRDVIVGRRAGELLPALISSGLHEELRRTVESGVAYRVAGYRLVGAEIGGRLVDGRYDMGAMRLGDGYLSVWRDIGDGDSASDELDRAMHRMHALIRMIRLESHGHAALRPSLAT